MRFGALKNQVIVGKIDDGGNASHMGYALRMDGSNQVRFEVGDGSNSYHTSRYTSTTNRWYQFVGVVDATNDRIKLYRDGALLDESTTLTNAIKNTTTPLRIGSYNDNDYSQNLNGDVGVVRIYKRALSSADVEQNYKETVLTYAVISNISDQNFTGSAITISPTVSLNGSTLTEGVDYTTTFTNNINAGVASLTINGIGTYLGSRTASFTILPDTIAPSVLLADSDQDNVLISTDTVTLTAFFSESMSTTPTISILSGVISNTLFTSKYNGIVQIGQSINGQANDWLGFYSQVSDDGKTIVIGGMRSGGTGNGYAKVLRWNGTEWAQLGNTITGSTGEGYGRTVAISGNGQVITVGGGGSNYTGKYGVYTLVNNTWTLRGGSFILGEADQDLYQSGSSIHMRYKCTKK